MQPAFWEMPIWADRPTGKGGFHVTKLAPGLHARTGVEVDPLAYDCYTGRWSRLFVPDTIAAASVQHGDTVLDVWTGTGEAAICLLPAIGGPGTLIGADI